MKPNQNAFAIDTNKKNIIMEVLQKSVDFYANNRQLKQKKIIFFLGGGVLFQDSNYHIWHPIFTYHYIQTESLLVIVCSVKKN